MNGGIKSEKVFDAFCDLLGVSKEERSEACKMVITLESNELVTVSITKQIKIIALGMGGEGLKP